MVLTEGWDLPDVGCIVLARPTKSMGLFRQISGRVHAAGDGKTDGVVIDHSAAVHRHGFLEDHVTWTLDPDKRARNGAHEKRGASGIIECVNCGAALAAGDPCPACGFMPRNSQYVVHLEGELGLVKRKRKAGPRQWTHEERMEWWGQLAGIAEERGYKAGWGRTSTSRELGRFPRGRQAPSTLYPTPEVRRWVASGTWRGSGPTIRCSVVRKRGGEIDQQKNALFQLERCAGSAQHITHDN